MEQCQGELMFLAVVAIPAVAAFIAWILKHTPSVDLGSEHAPVTYWGAYHDSKPAANLKGVALPHTPYEDIESASHIHTITVHP
ncbi:MAG TPA: hypothetical protein V6C81_00165 [Planktothrix sp.]|jgi:hypothetical protein